MNDLSLIYVFVVCFLIFGVLVLNMYISFAKERIRQRNLYVEKYSEAFKNMSEYYDRINVNEKLGKHYKINNDSSEKEYVEVIDVDTGEVINYYYDK